MTAAKLLRTIRLDPSDTFVFARAAEPGEWAVTGSFLFVDADVEAMGPKERTAFRSGFLGVSSFGWSTLAIVTPVTEAEREELLTTLATRLMRDLGAPDIEAARHAAAEEIAFAASLCDHPAQTLVAVHRCVEDGELRERFRTLVPRAEALGPEAVKGGFRAFDFFEVDGEDETPADEVDLLALMKDKG
ncbi:MAG: DUF6505 family protein [Hyphomicrobiales bacterium]|nr:DUF6505 family protein [Hyphomicrobiales bacterium]